MYSLSRSGDEWTLIFQPSSGQDWIWLVAGGAGIFFLIVERGSVGGFVVLAVMLLAGWLVSQQTRKISTAVFDMSTRTATLDWLSFWLMDRSRSVSLTEIIGLDIITGRYGSGRVHGCQIVLLDGTVVRLGWQSTGSDDEVRDLLIKLRKALGVDGSDNVEVTTYLGD